MINKTTSCIKEIVNNYCYTVTVRQVATWYIGKISMEDYLKHYVTECIEQELAYLKEINIEHYEFLKDKLIENELDFRSHTHVYYDNEKKKLFELRGHLFKNDEPYISFKTDMGYRYY